MQLALALTVLTVASVFAECDMGGLGEAQHPVALRLCKLEQEVAVLENAVQELLQRADVTLTDDDVTVPQKRKNEFIRFGKRKNEFIRFGKRKNEFIRFGRSDPELSADVEKRKNEFIRFG